MESLLVANDFDRNGLTRTMVATMQYLPERTLTKCIDDLVPVGQVIVMMYYVVSTIIIITVIICRMLTRSDLLVR
jgi:hypothetical protein